MVQRNGCKVCRNKKSLCSNCKLRIYYSKKAEKHQRLLKKRERGDFSRSRKPKKPSIFRQVGSTEKEEREYGKKSEINEAINLIEKSLIREETSNLREEEDGGIIDEDASSLEKEREELEKMVKGESGKENEDFRKRNAKKKLKKKKRKKKKRKVGMKSIRGKKKRKKKTRK